MEFISTIFRISALIIFYAITGFGPGFIIGALIANATSGRGQEKLADQHDKNLKAAAEHNSQWNPTHERWQKP